MDSLAEQVEAPPPAAPTERPLLSLTGVAKRWPRVPRPVLEDVDLEVAPGEVVAVTGRNGAGKTTLLRIAAGLILPEAGTVRVAGRDPERERIECQRRLGFLSAGNSGLFGRLRVEQHLDYWSRLALLPRAGRTRAVAETMDRFRLAELCGKRVDRLSMGQRQRVRIALAFLHRPSLLLLDEPRTSLDEEGAALLRDAVAERAAHGGAAVVCAPAGEDAGLELHRTLAVEDGRLVPA